MIKQWYAHNTQIINLLYFVMKSYERIRLQFLNYKFWLEVASVFINIVIITRQTVFYDWTVIRLNLF